MNKCLIKYASIIILTVIPVSAFTRQDNEANEMIYEDRDTKFFQLLNLPWKKQFTDSGKENWKGKWFLDGDLATVENTPEGMIFSAGPNPSESSSHAVLWTKDSFKGNVKIEWDYTRLDSADRFVNIVYIQGTGINEGKFKKDIRKWADFRREPYMKYYYDNMNLFHISYAVNSANNDYVRLRRYPTGPEHPFKETVILPDYFNTGLFLPYTTYHFTVIKMDDELFFEVKNDQVRKLFHWSVNKVNPVTEGRIGIRHMCTRVARYANISIAVIDDLTDK
jgi:hypothetical protein